MAPLRTHIYTHSSTVLRSGVTRTSSQLQLKKCCDGASLYHSSLVPIDIYINNNSCRYLHSSTTIYQAKSQKDLFTPSPFTRSSRINVSDKFAIYRDLKEGHDNVYGVRRYLLLPRTEDDRYIDYDENYTPKHIIASLNANRM